MYIFRYRCWTNIYWYVEHKVVWWKEQASRSAALRSLSPHVILQAAKPVLPSAAPLSTPQSSTITPSAQSLPAVDSAQMLKLKQELTDAKVCGNMSVYGLCIKEPLSSLHSLHFYPFLISVYLSIFLSLSFSPHIFVSSINLHPRHSLTGSEIIARDFTHWFRTWSGEKGECGVLLCDSFCVENISI